mmetsp:Transcript_34618/g.55332  ORF Transcript_34618/g.55332 Transcript_34618/m.55332 type:complete len:1020 (-) Transcript_34618:3264-6323(-)|eukprot:CAMPEP_0203751060 /NCGR_PEP_ID=MMETSP0098-20131031/5197_1 /ASSEMBLY_ACC=CAM_ASM_000208 /TAXON_ID=96639 /ORGANISM=" , Strain NY0313808BC1" /LENGTH=1019 /DNA_ID=CAMNT_0050640623 /DNA_START=120 /DNA_END=3179 /DNA_ORIENTATION=+
MSSKSSEDQVAELKEEIASLKLKLSERDAEIVALKREVPLGVAKNKTRRLEMSTKLLQQVDGTGSGIEWPASKVRDTFIGYFEDKCEHTFWRSSPVVPHNDPTLLFANAGMNQYKPLFLGQADPSTALANLKRATNTQKCIRAGGKHNDLEDVGKDVYHHTFFEMLGNWSFGDYFKQEAIDWAWDLLTNVYKIPAERLYITYFEGNDQVPEDLEAKNMWLKHVPEERILAFDAKDNFWEMGDVGPCGPCSEIHYDRIGGRDAASLVNMDDPDVLEIWNLVFMQYNRKPGGVLEKLPACHIDTGMGFERLTSILQNKRSNYDTDIFTVLFEAIEKKANVPPYGGKVGKDDVGNIDMAYRVVADHIRTLSFAIADGAFPSNQDRGYVLRRVLRRAVRYGTDVLKMPKESFSGLVSVLVKAMKDTFPELAEKEKVIYETILDEEQTFARTLKKGLERFEKEVEALKQSNEKLFPGKLAFFLFDSMGFPYDLTELMAEEHGLEMDKVGFENAMAAHVEKSRAVKKRGADGAGTLRKMEAKETSYLEDQNVPVTDKSTMLEWHKDLPGARVMAIFDGENFVDQVAQGSDRAYGFVLDKSNFYYESGGQMGDTGKLALGDSGVYVSVADTQSSKGFIVHVGVVTSEEDDSGAIKVGDTVTCCVDYDRRGNLAKNHTCTHLLNFALRKHVANDIDQKGSVVQDSKLTFDFNFKSGVNSEKLIKVEHEVNQKISDSLPVYTKVVPLADAKRISSLRAVFGETYPDPVRVVTVGAPIEQVLADPLNEKWGDYSVELCGGTHLGKSSEARKFAIIKEAPVAKGIRRVVCVTGDAAFEAASLAEELRARLDNAAGLQGKELQKEVKSLNHGVQEAAISVTDQHELNLAVQQISRKCLELEKAEYAEASKLALEAVNVALADKKPFIVHRIASSGAIASKLGSEVTKKTKKTPIVFLLVQADEDSGTVSVCASVPKPLQAKLSAKDWVQTAGQSIDVKGGGSPALFNGKGNGVENMSIFIQAANEFAQQKL